MELSAMKVIEHAWGTDEDDSASVLACTVRESARQKRLSRTGVPDEEGIDPLVEKREVVHRQIAGADLLATRVEVEVEAIDSVDLWKGRRLDAPLDGVANAAVLLFVAEAIHHLERRQVVFGGFLEECRESGSHSGQPKPA